MSTVATDLITPVKKVFDGTGPVIYSGLTKKEWIGSVILNGVLRDRDNISGLSNSQIVTLAVVRANALIAALGTTGSDLVDPPAELRMGNSPQIGLSKKEYMAAHLISGFQGDNINVDALNPAPTAATDTLKGATPGNMGHIAVPGAPTAALITGGVPGAVDSLDPPIAPTAAAAGAGALDDMIVSTPPTMAMSGSTPGTMNHIVPTVAPTMAAGAAGDVDIGAHYYVYTYVTNDGESTMSPISAVINIADAAKHVAVTVTQSTFAGVIDINIYRCKVDAAHAVYTDFFLVGAIGSNAAGPFDDNTASGSLPVTTPPAANTAAKYEYCLTYVTADGETTMSNVSAAAVTVANNAVDGQVVVTVPAPAFPGVTARNIYRCKAGTVAISSTRTHYFYVGQIVGSGVNTFTDTVDEATAIGGANPPAASTAAGYKYVCTYVTADGGQSLMLNVQTVKTTVAAKAADGKTTVTIPAGTAPGIVGRKVYRCRAGMTTTATERTQFYLIKDFSADNTTLTWDDEMTDAAAIAGGVQPPATNSAGGHKYCITYTTIDGETTMGTPSAQVLVLDKSVNGKIGLSGIPASTQPGVVNKNIYRSKAGVLAGTTRTNYFLVGTIANAVTIFTPDNTADGDLPATTPPATNTAGTYSYKVTQVSASGESEASNASGGVIIASAAAGQCDLTDIDLGPTGTLSRKIYRTKCGYGSVGPWYYHPALSAQVADNTTEAAVDNTADSGLTTSITAPSADTAWEGLLAVDVVAKKDALVAALASTETEPVYPFGKVVSVAGSESIAGVTKQEHFASIIEAGYISDSANITAIGDDAALAAQANTLATAFVVALNA